MDKHINYLDTQPLLSLQYNRTFRVYSKTLAYGLFIYVPDQRTTLKFWACIKFPVKMLKNLYLLLTILEKFHMMDDVSYPQSIIDKFILASKKFKQEIKAE